MPTLPKRSRWLVNERLGPNARLDTGKYGTAVVKELLESNAKVDPAVVDLLDVNNDGFVASREIQDAYRNPASLLLSAKETAQLPSIAAVVQPYETRLSSVSRSSNPPAWVWRLPRVERPDPDFELLLMPEATFCVDQLSDEKQQTFARRILAAHNMGDGTLTPRFVDGLTELSRLDHQELRDALRDALRDIPFDAPASRTENVVVVPDDGASSTKIDWDGPFEAFIDSEVSSSDTETTITHRLRLEIPQNMAVLAGEDNDADLFDAENPLTAKNRRALRKRLTVYQDGEYVGQYRFPAKAVEDLVGTSVEPFDSRIARTKNGDTLNTLPKRTKAQPGEYFLRVRECGQPVDLRLRVFDNGEPVVKRDGDEEWKMIRDEPVQIHLWSLKNGFGKITASLSPDNDELLLTSEVTTREWAIKDVKTETQTVRLSGHLRNDVEFDLPED